MDIGGTHTRARLLNAGPDLANDSEIINEESVIITDKRSLMDFIQGFILQQDAVITTAVLSIAGPVNAKSVTITNWTGKPEISFDELVSPGLPAERTLFVNDMEAAANCLIAFKKGKTRLEVISQFEASGSSNIHFDNSILIIPGTGVGIAGIVTPLLGGEPAHVSCELQHTLIPEPVLADAGLMDAMKKRLNRGYLTWEDFVSGKGLENLYYCLLAMNSGGKGTTDLPGAGVIAENAVNGTDKICADALNYYYDVAGALTQVVALAFQPFAGVYIGGATTKKNLAFIRQSAFIEKFQDNEIRGDLLKSFPVHLVPEYMNLDGAMYLASQL